MSYFIRADREGYFRINEDNESELGIRDNDELKNTIEATRTSPLVNLTFNNYVNFITEETTSKRGR